MQNKYNLENFVQFAFSFFECCLLRQCASEWNMNIFGPSKTWKNFTIDPCRKWFSLQLIFKITFVRLKQIRPNPLLPNRPQNAASGHIHHENQKNSHRFCHQVSPNQTGFVSKRPAVLPSSVSFFPKEQTNALQTHQSFCVNMQDVMFLSKGQASGLSMVSQVSGLRSGRPSDSMRPHHALKHKGKQPVWVQLPSTIKTISETNKSLKSTISFA